LCGEDSFGGSVDVRPCCYVSFLESRLKLTNTLLCKAFFDVLTSAEGEGSVAKALDDIS
jgi:hypothetical protein